MSFNLSKVALAEIDIPSTTTINTQLNDLLQPGGERIEPAAEYEARDATASIRVVVDAQRKLTDVSIHHNWASRILPAQLAGVLFDTYVKAIQRAMVVELANAGDSPTDHRPVDAPVDDIDARPYDEWIAAIRARISAVDAQLEDIRRLEMSREPPSENDFRSPLGFFVLHLRGGSPTGVTGSVNALSKAGPDRLQQDFLEIFSAAGLATPTGPVAQPGPRSDRGAAQEDDEYTFQFRYDV